MKRASYLFSKLYNEILSGQYWKNGDQFMTVRDFAKQYTCSLHCALDAFNMLLDSRILRKAGKHCYITTGCCPLDSPYGKILFDSNEKLFGVLLNDNSNPFFGALIDSLQDILVQNGMDMIIATSTGDPKRQQQILDLFIKHKCAGVFNCVPIPYEQQELYKFYPLPIVTLAEDGSPGNTNTITVDNSAAGKQVAKHLLDCGCRSFAYITLDTYIESDMRLQGYVQQLTASQISLDSHNVAIVSSNDDSLRNREVSQFIGSLLNNADSFPLGIFCVHDLLAVDVMRIIKHSKQYAGKKLHIPEDVKIVGFDDLPISSLVSIPITTVSYPYSAMAKKAFDVMIDLLQNPSHQPNCYEIQSSLVIRNSSLDPRR